MKANISGVVGLGCATVVVAMSATVMYPLFAHPRRGGGSHVRPPSVPELRMRERARALHARARSAIGRHEYGAAESDVRQVMAIEHPDASTWLLLAEACDRQGKVTEELAAYRAALSDRSRASRTAADPEIAMRYVLLLARSDRSRWREAVGFYRGADREPPSGFTGPVPCHARFDADHIDWEGLAAAAHYLLALRHSFTATLEPVSAEMQHLRQALELRPTWPEVQLAYGQALLRQGKWRQAEKPLRVAQTATDARVVALANDALRSVEGHRAWEAQKAREAAAKAAESGNDRK